MFENVNHIILKVTRDCNLNCTYCYLLDKSKFKGEILDISVLKLLLDRLSLDKKQGDKIKITFHGGEPTLMGVERFSTFLQLIKEFKENHKFNIQVSIQTNSTLLNDEFLELCHRYDVMISVSFDGIESNNRYRCNTGIRTLNNLIKIKEKNINLGVLGLVNSSNLKEISTTSYLLSSLKIPYRWNRCEDIEGNLDLEASYSDYFTYSILPQATKFIHGEKILDSQVVDKLERMTKFISEIDYPSESGICNVKYCGVGSRVIAIDPNGDIIPCGRYGDSSKPLGSLFSYDFLSLSYYRNLIEIREESNKAYQYYGCDTCVFDPVCEHHCMAFSSRKEKFDKDLCNMTKLLYNFCLENIQTLIRLFNIPKDKLKSRFK